MSKESQETRAQYAHFSPITTRWMDNDIYGHVNNVTYYSYFDSVANQYLIEHGQLDIHNGDIVGFVVNSGCSYMAPIAYPEKIEGALRVNKLGNSSVEYGLAIFKEGEELAVAQGHFVHVFVNKETSKPVAIPNQLRNALEKIKI